MTQENEGVKSVYSDEYQKLLVNIVTSTGWLSDQLKKHLATEQITPQQYHILKILQHNGRPLSTMQLRQRMPDKMSDTSRIVERMLVKKLVVKKMNKVDRRLVEISLTLQGEGILGRIEQESSLMSKVVCNQLSTDEAAQLNHLLLKLRGHTSTVSL